MLELYAPPRLTAKEIIPTCTTTRDTTSLRRPVQPTPQSGPPSATYVRRRSLIAAIAVTLIPVTAREGTAAQGSPGGNGDWSSPGLATPVDNLTPEFFQTASGVRVQELAQGSGPGAEEGDQIELEYVLRRTNGYFIYSTREGVSFQPKDVPTGPLEMQLGDKNVIAGLQDAVLGMKAGGKRRVLVPPERGYTSGMDLQPTPPTYAAQRQILNHAKEPLMFELQLVKIRNKGR